MISQRRAKQLWAKLNQHLVSAEKAIQEIIEAKAWEPLGYGTFAEAWAAEMSNSSLASEIRPHVVYQMLDEGWTAEDIANAVKGVSPNGAALLDRQRRNGVPPNHAVVREHYRRPASPPSHIRIDVGATMLGEYHRIALEVGESVEAIALEAIRERFRELAVVKKRRKVAV